MYYRICNTVGVEAGGIPTSCVCKANIDEIFEAYLLGLQDYTIDSRGDAGAWYVCVLFQMSIYHCL